ncbi:ribonuclease P protein component [Collinsella sp. AGMB00827]|uniref:Ribonuclease P protein component n=1 Tax=Collinsella ureilytica TaxID=2869515 RepID=A0ABS7MKG6_9ACTN|nr:ribonuclease P protein component [Collinsella urealyticum]MBY4797803.1 ribonuclease P protein component [Collinsella urealyticum]
MRTIKSPQDFERVFSRGKRYNHPLLRMVIQTCLDEGDPGRVAFVAAKRLGTAVFRNRSKRMLRAAAYQCGFPLPGYDLILFATKDTAAAHIDELSQALQKLVRRSGATAQVNQCLNTNKECW